MTLAADPAAAVPAGTSHGGKRRWSRLRGRVPAGSSSQDSTRARCRALPCTAQRHSVGGHPFPQQLLNGGMVTPGDRNKAGGAREKGMSWSCRKAARQQEGATAVSSWSWAGRDQLCGKTGLHLHTGRDKPIFSLILTDTQKIFPPWYKHTAAKCPPLCTPESWQQGEGVGWREAAQGLPCAHSTRNACGEPDRR